MLRITSVGFTNGRAIERFGRPLLEGIVLTSRSAVLGFVAIFSEYAVGLPLLAFPETSRRQTQQKGGEKDLTG
jgi:hypothetical protein